MSTATSTAAGRGPATTITRILQVAFAVVFLVQIWVNVQLQQRVRSLQTALEESNRAAASDKFRVGDIVPPLPVRTADGREIFLNPAATRKNMLLLFIDPQCETCRTAVAELRKTDLKKRAVLVFSVRDEGTSELAREHRISDFTYTLVRDAMPIKTQMKVAHMPVVLLLTPSARITRVCDRPANCV